MTNEERFKEIYQTQITRTGAPELLAWLESTDFFTAPARRAGTPFPAGRAGKRGGTVNCAICGKPVERVRPCEYYRRRGEAVCDECCEECYRTEPFPCPDHDQREELEG